MLKQVIRRLVHWAHDPTEVPEGVLVRGADMLLESLPLGLLVHPISNGYIMRIDDTSQSLLVYAKDEKGIADEIIAHQARMKLKVPRQGELFGHDITPNVLKTKQHIGKLAAATTTQRSK